MHSLSIPECWLFWCLDTQMPSLKCRCLWAEWQKANDGLAHWWHAGPLSRMSSVVLKGYAHLSWFIQCQLLVDCILYCRYCDHWCTSLDIVCEVEYRDYVQGIVPSITALLQVFREALGKQWGDRSSEMHWNILKQERKSSCLWWHVSFVWLWSVVGFMCCQPFGIQHTCHWIYIVWMCYNVLYGHPKRHATEYCFIYRWSECSSVVWRLSGMSPFSFPAMSLCVGFKKANLPIFWSTWWRWGPEDGFFNSMDRFYGPIGQGPEGLVETKKNREMEDVFFSALWSHEIGEFRWNTSLNALYNHKPNGGEARQQVLHGCASFDSIMSLCMWCTLRDIIECNHLDFALAKKSCSFWQFLVCIIFLQEMVVQLQMHDCWSWTHIQDVLPEVAPKTLEEKNVWCTRATPWICLMSHQWSGWCQMAKAAQRKIDHKVRHDIDIDMIFLFAQKHRRPCGQNASEWWAEAHYTLSCRSLGLIQLFRRRCL